MAYQIADDVHWCKANGRYVFLDLSADEYLALDHSGEIAFAAIMNGNLPDDASGSGIQRLLDDGLIEPSDQPKPTSAPAELSPPSFAISIVRGPKSGLQIILQALVCHLATVWKLRRATLGQAIALVPPSAPAQHALPADEILCSRVSAFAATSRLVSTQDQCVRSSIALIRFLNRFGYRPHLVIGVRMHPFRAHAWVQHGAVVLTGGLDDVLAFTPILVR